MSTRREQPWAANYRMWTYVTEELPRSSRPNSLPTWVRRAITGHSMGGHGALTVALALPIASAASPRSRRSSRRPGAVGQKALGSYLGEDRADLAQA